MELMLVIVSAIVVVALRLVIGYIALEIKERRQGTTEADK